MNRQSRLPDGVSKRNKPFSSKNFCGFRLDQLLRVIAQRLARLQDREQIPSGGSACTLMRQSRQLVEVAANRTNLGDRLPELGE